MSVAKYENLITDVDDLTNTNYKNNTNDKYITDNTNNNLTNTNYKYTTDNTDNNLTNTNYTDNTYTKLDTSLNHTNYENSDSDDSKSENSELGKSIILKNEEKFSMIYDVNEVNKTETLFIDKLIDHVYTFGLMYNHKKINQLYPEKKLLGCSCHYVKCLRYDNDLYSELCKNFDRKLSYINKIYDENYTTDMFALYLNPNRKSLITATNVLVNTITNNLFHDKASLTKLINKSLDNRLNSIIAGQNHIDWFHFEIDSKETSHIKYLSDVLNKYSINTNKFFTIETTNGYHLLIKKELVSNKNYKELLCDLFEKCPTIVNSLGNKEPLLTKLSNGWFPIPGTYQRGFKVKFTNIF